MNSAWIQLFGTIITAATFIYVVIQTRNISKQTKNLERSIIGNTISQIISNHRELWSKTFDCPEFGKLLLSEKSKSDDEVKNDLFLSMLISIHCFSKNWSLLATD